MLGRTKMIVITLLLAVGLMAPALVSAEQTCDFMGWSAEEPTSKPVVMSMLDGFTKESGIKVNWIGYAWSDMQKNLFLKLRSKQIPDAIQMQARWLPTFARLPEIVDFNEVFGQEFLESQIDSGILELGRIGGKQYGVPWVAGSVGMVANQKVLDAAGVKQIPTTMEEFVEACKAVKKAKPSAVPYSLNSKNNKGIILDFQIWLWTFGGKLFDDQKNVVVNSAESVAALQWMVDMIDQGLSAKDIDRPDSRRLFGQEEAAFYFDAPVAKGFARKFSGQGEAYDANVVPMATPVVEAGQPPRSVQWGHVLIMFKKDGKMPAKESAGAQLIQYLAMNEAPGIEYFNGVGLFPVAKTALDTDTVKSDTYTSQWSKFAQTALRNELAGWENTADMTNVIGEEVQAALLGQKPAAKAIEDMAARLEPLMAKNR